MRILLNKNVLLTVIKLLRLVSALTLWWIWFSPFIFDFCFAFFLFTKWTLSFVTQLRKVTLCGRRFYFFVSFILRKPDILGDKATILQVKPHHMIHLPKLLWCNITSIRCLLIFNLFRIILVFTACVLLFTCIMQIFYCCSAIVI